MSNFYKLIKDWMLVFAMLAGVFLYVMYRECSFLHPYGGIMLEGVKIVQPLLLFTMLFLSFSRIRPSELKPHKWQFWLLLIQSLFFILPNMAVFFLGGFSGALADWRVVMESFTLCMICPTATACSVLTAKLGGDRAAVMTYTIFINLAVAVLVPLIVPLIRPMPGMEFWNAFLLIMGKVFPMLILPCLLAWLVRYTMPSFHKYVSQRSELAFTIWAVSLVLAILMSTRAIYHTSCGLEVLGGIAIASFISCAFQFWAGKKIGEHYQDRITAGQSMGQKNTVFAIWMGYTFLDPLTSVAGGFYSIWHNLFNSWQLYRLRNGKQI